MCKKTFVALAKGTRRYKLYSEDILQVHKLISKKRPPIPKYDLSTEGESDTLNGPLNSHLMTL